MNIVIIDDDRLVALSLQTILESSGDIHVLATGDSGDAAVKLYRELQPDVLLMDIRMEKMSGLEASSRILSEFPNARILLLTTFSDDEYIVKALRLGVKGYILKQNFENIAPALAAVCGGQTVFGDEIVGRLPDILSQPSTSYDEAPYGSCSHTAGLAHGDSPVSDTANSSHDDNSDCHTAKPAYTDNIHMLAERELDIIHLVADGQNNKEIAHSLFLSEGTVRNYISSVLEKLELRDRTQLACWYYKNVR